MHKKTIHTLGHSNHPAEYFLELLEAHGINCVVDVRSIPASQYNPQYNKPVLENFLRENDILYLHFGKEFGARRNGAHLLTEEGKVDFEKVRETETFRQGVRRLEEGLEKGFSPALMCAEADPFDCHRFSMISGHLQEAGFEVRHILKNKEVVSHEKLEAELLRRFAKKLPQPDIFNPDVTREDQRKAAYRLHNERVGWSG